MKYSFVFDFDSTIITKESLDEVLLLNVHNNKKETLKKQLEEITNQGMNGEIDLKTSIKKRINLLALQKNDIINFQDQVTDFITPGIPDIIKLLQKNNCDIYFISGGLLDCILPIAKKLNISEKNCFANTYKIKDNKIILDEQNPLIRSDGKSKIIQNIKKLSPTNKIVIVGDGISDLIPFEEKIADEFIGFGINKVRPTVQQRAPKYFTKIDELYCYIVKLFNLTI